MTSLEERRCGACRFMIGAPAALEQAIPGMNILSSAYGSVRAGTGLCSKHDSFVTDTSAACAAFCQMDGQAAPSLRNR